MAASPLPPCQQDDVVLEDEDIGIPDLFPEEREEHIPPGPMPSTRKMLGSWEAVPRKILQPSPEPVRVESGVQAHPKKQEQMKKKNPSCAGLTELLLMGSGRPTHRHTP